MRKSRTLKYGLQFILVGMLYFATGKLGLALGQVSRYATSIWAPTGISLAVVMLGGYRFLPAIFFAAMAVNYSIASNPFTALGIGFGNTLEAYVAVALIRHYSPDFSPKLHRLRDVMSLIFYGALVSTLLCATIGVSSLWIFGNIPDLDVLVVWRTWWMGDLLGDVLCASFLMVWFSEGVPKFKKLKWVELACLLFTLSLSIMLVYHRQGEPSGQVYPTTYVVFPFIIWVGLRFEQLGTVAIVLLVTLLTIYFTATGEGPYSNDTPARSFFFLQTFHVVISCSGMILASVMMEKKELYKKAQEAVQAREDFLTIASHELRTPITLLHMNLQRIERNIMKSPEQTNLQRDILSSIKASKVSSMHLVSMVDSLLDISQVRSGKLCIHRQSMNLSVLINKVVQGFSEFANQHETRIEIKMKEQIIGDFDSDRIEQVLFNLISNAIKYGKKKAILISVEDDPGEVTMQVIDRGIGISDNMLEKIFDRFERAVGYSNISGLGLGLYISRQIVEAHQVVIKVESRLDHGSCFTVALPKKENTLTGSV